MAATIHVTVTKGVSFPVYILPGTPAAGTPPTAGILVGVHVKAAARRMLKGTEEEVQNKEGSKNSSTEDLEDLESTAAA